MIAVNRDDLWLYFDHANRQRLSVRTRGIEFHYHMVLNYLRKLRARHHNDQIRAISTEAMIRSLAHSGAVTWSLRFERFFDGGKNLTQPLKKLKRLLGRALFKQTTMLIKERV